MLVFILYTVKPEKQLKSSVILMLNSTRFLNIFCVFGDRVHRRLLASLTNDNICKPLTKTPWWGFYFSKTDSSPESFFFKYFLSGTRKKKGGTDD